jgi:hypothetical protein
MLRALAVAEPTGEETPGYVEGLGTAIGAAIDHAIAVIEHGPEGVGATPAELMAQARSAARSGVGLEVVLRRYAAGYSALGEFLRRLTRDLSTRASSEVLYSIERDLATLFDRLVEVVSKEYREEADRTQRPSGPWRSDSIRRLLAGELPDTSVLNYDLEVHHVCVIARGPRGETGLRDVSSTLDRRSLFFEGGGQTLSVWLGGRQSFDRAELDELADFQWPPETLVAAGEPAQGLPGWRLTYRQATAALGVALRRPQPYTRYGEVALVAAVSKDNDLLSFLAKTYLAPLATERDGGEALRRTLRAYLHADRNVSSAAAALGIARQTVASRLQVIETRVGRPLASCGAEFEAILHLIGPGG